ncbi:c-type cytochrome [Tropicimonas aquimaris]|uniref:C-type cytochrome n=1 Tax=Tropicimonas aquimaris TaxID=914152 RepID=A0ABW3IQH9_9RHOB
MKKTILAAIAISIPCIALADAATDAVKARQDHMKAFGKQVGTFAAVAKGEAEYDPAVAQAAADMLVELANADQSGFWMEGTSMDDLPGVSYAKPALWENTDQVTAIMTDLQAAAANMQDVASDGKDAMVAALGPIGQQCQACHKEFQAKKD